MTPLCFVSLQPCRVWTIDLPELIPVISEVAWLRPELRRGRLLLIYSAGGGMRWDSKDTVTHEKKTFHVVVTTVVGVHMFVYDVYICTVVESN